MDERTKELIAIGASVSAHCQPCLSFHLGKARKLGIGEDEIREATEIGRTVEKGAASAMKKFVSQLLSQTQLQDGGCCSDRDSKCCAVVEREERRTTMKQSKLQVYDPPMCCSSGVCGPKVDPKLVRFSSDLDWLKKQGVVARRFNLSSHPAEFARQECVREALTKEGNDCLPLIVVEGAIVSRGIYPSRKELMKFAGIDGSAGKE